jgi:hypothetical protein
MIRASAAAVRSSAVSWQALALWIVLAASVLFCAIGLFVNRPWEQEIWSPTGWRRLLLFAALFTVTWLVARWRRGPFLPILMAGMLTTTVMIAGPAATAAVVYIVVCMWAFGRLLLRRSFAIRSFGDELLHLLLGIAAWQAIVGLAAHLPVNGRLSHIVVMAVPVAMQPRLLTAAWRALRLGFRSASMSTPSLSVALTGFVMCCHWATAMRPEVSADGLAMHLVIPSAVAQHGRWWYDVDRYSWAVMPMAGDWAYTTVFLLGGEWAAKLLNFGLLAAIVALIGWVASRWVPVAAATLVAGLFAATPLVHLVTGNLFVENFQAAMLLGALVSIGLTRERSDASLLMMAAALLGAGMSTKFGTVSYAVPLLFAAGFASKVFDWRPRVKAGLLFLVVASPPYLTAYFLTGNPVFPFMNSVFRSPYFESAELFRDLRFVAPLSPRTLYDATFHTSRFFEAQDGALGYQYLLLIPVCIVALLSCRGQPWLASVSLAVGLAGAVLTWLGASNVRYCYAALPMLALAIAGVLGSVRPRHPLLHRTLLGVCAASVVSGTLLLSTSGWWKDFFLNPFDPRETSRYLAEFAPGRVLVDYLNTHHPDRPVLFLVNGQTAGLRGRVYLNSWHNDTFYRRLQSTTSPAEVTACCHRKVSSCLWFPARGGWANSRIRCCVALWKIARLPNTK